MSAPVHWKNGCHGGHARRRSLCTQRSPDIASITKPTATKGAWRSASAVGVTDANAARALASLLPFLRIKRQQAENCLALRAAKNESKPARVARGRGHVGARAKRRPFRAYGGLLSAKPAELNHAGI